MGDLIELSTDLNVITAEINSYKNVAGQAIFEIGKRLKHVKKNDLAKGQFTKWAKENCDFDSSMANRFIKAYEEIPEESIPLLGTAKVFQIVALPPDVDRQNFIEQPHTIPSTGEKKTVDEMTVRELREVKKALKQAESKAEQAQKSEEIMRRQLEKMENEPPQKEVVEIVKEVIPKDVTEKISQKELTIVNLKNELSMLKKRNEYLSKQDEKEQEVKYLAYEADKSVLTLKLGIDEFLKDFAITAFRKGAIASSSDETRSRLKEGIDEMKDFFCEVELALNGRIDLRKRGEINV